MGAQRPIYPIITSKKSFQMTPSTTKNVRDIISAVENMYECVNSPPTNNEERDVLMSYKAEHSNAPDQDQKVMKLGNSHLSDIVINTMATQDKHKLEDTNVPEPPRRSKQRHNKLNGKITSPSNNNNSSSVAANIINRTENNCSLPTDNKYLCEGTPYETELISSTTSSRPTAMDLAAACAGGKRSMWAELREVVNSGVLGN